MWGRIWRASDVRAYVVNSEGACCDLHDICRRNGWSVPVRALIKVVHRDSGEEDRVYRNGIEGGREGGTGIQGTIAVTRSDRRSEMDACRK